MIAYILILIQYLTVMFQIIIPFWQKTCISWNIKTGRNFSGVVLLGICE